MGELEGKVALVTGASTGIGRASAIALARAGAAVVVSDIDTSRGPEVAELLGVALLMDGGTASVYAPRAWEAFQEFAADRRPAGTG